MQSVLSSSSFPIKVSKPVGKKRPSKSPAKRARVEFSGKGFEETQPETLIDVKPFPSRNNPTVQISPIDSTDIKAANNKGFMQNNYGKDGSYYNAGISSGHYYLNAQNSSRWVRMSDNKSWDEKLSLVCSRAEESQLIIPDLPEIDHLMEVYSAEYKKRLLNKVLDYKKIVSFPCLEKSSTRGIGRTFDNPMNPSQQLDFSRLSQEDLAAIEAYRIGVGLLKLDREKDGKKEIKKAADKGLPHARYVYAIIIFKNIVLQHMDSKSRLPTNKDINEAIKYMHGMKQEFFPLPSFVLGIMQSYNPMLVSKNLVAQVTSARDCFDDVLSGIRYSEGNYSLSVPRKYIVMEDESAEFFKWIVQSAKYELARGMLIYQEDLSNAKSLFQELSSGGFVYAKCLYALALLKNAFRDGEYLKKGNFYRAYTLLEQAINHGHKEAMFFFGTLPFRQEFKHLDKETQSRKGSYCFSYLGMYMEACGRDGKFKKDAAVLIAAEYVKEKNSYVLYDEEHAKNILRENDCSYELQELEKKLQERQERANNVLPDVLGALEHVHSELKKDTKPSAQQLSSTVKDLLNALQGSGLIVQQSPLLPPTLQLLHTISSTQELRFLLPPLQLLYEILESQVGNQSHCSSQKEVLSSLRSLFLTCSDLQIKRIRSISPIPS